MSFIHPRVMPPRADRHLSRLPSAVNVIVMITILLISCETVSVNRRFTSGYTTLVLAAELAFSLAVANSALQ